MARKFFKFTKSWSRGPRHIETPKIRKNRPLFYFYMDDGAYVKVEVFENEIKLWASDGVMKVIAHAPNVLKIEVEA